MITFPFPNIYLSFGYICYCFFFLVFDIMRKIVMPFTSSSFTLKVFKRSYIGQDAATSNEIIKNHRVKYWKKMD